MRVTTAFKRLLCLTGITVSGVEFGKSTVVVTVKLTARKLQCPLCVFTTKARSCPSNPLSLPQTAMVRWGISSWRTW